MLDHDALINVGLMVISTGSILTYKALVTH